MEAQTIIETTVSSIAIRAGQLNLFTGEQEAGALDESVSEVQGWLFDPDWNLVLPENVAGREIFIDEGVSLTFPLRQSMSLENHAHRDYCLINRDVCRFQERVVG